MRDGKCRIQNFAKVTKRFHQFWPIREYGKIYNLDPSYRQALGNSEVAHSDGSERPGISACLRVEASCNATCPFEGTERIILNSWYSPV